MSARNAAWQTWSLAALSLAVVLASIALSVLARSVYIPCSWGASTNVGDLLVTLPFLAFLIVGALISSRRPQNPIGWICLVAGLFWMLIVLSKTCSAYGFARPGSVPFPVTMTALLYAWLWTPIVGLVVI